MSDEPIRPFEVNTPTRALALVAAIGMATSVASAAQGPIQGGQQSPAPTGAALIIGRVIHGTTGTPVVGVTVTIRGASASLAGSTVLVDSQGRFVFSGLPAGAFTLLAQKNVVVTFTDRPAELTGALQNSSGTRTADYFILVCSTDRTFWFPNSRRIVSVRPNSTGSYSVRNLPPGEYFLSALTDVETGEWFDPEFLRALVAAAPIRFTIWRGRDEATRPSSREVASRLPVEWRRAIVKPLS